MKGLALLLSQLRSTQEKGPKIKFHIFWWSDMSMISTLNILDGWMGEFLNIYCINYILFSAEGNSFADHWILCGTRIVFWFVCSIDYVWFYLVLKTKYGLRLVCGVCQCFVSRKFWYARWRMLFLPQDGHHHLALAWEGQICDKWIYVHAQKV